MIKRIAVRRIIFRLLLIFTCGQFIDARADETGRAAGAELLCDIRVGPQGAVIESLVTLENRVFFRAMNDEINWRLWVTNGTAAGTFPLQPGAFSAGPLDPRFIAIFQNRLYFSAKDGSGKRRFWSSDGTHAGTKVEPIPLPEFVSGLTNHGIHIQGAVVLGSHIFLMIHAGEYDKQLWKTDGTATGTQLVKNFGPVATVNSYRLTPWNGKFYFNFFTPDYGEELWVSDGTENGTQLLKDIHPGANKSEPHGMLAAGDYLFFAANHPTYWFELFRTDGTEAGTNIIKDLGPYDSFPRELIRTDNGSVFFSAGDPFHARRLWKTDGTSNGTVEVQSSPPLAQNPSGLTALGNDILFVASDGIWRSSGTASGTLRISGQVPSSPFVRVLKTFFFYSSDNSRGDELWMTDGTAAGTRFVKDVRPGSQGSSGVAPTKAAALNDMLVFTANDGIHGMELWRTIPKIETATNARWILYE